MQREFGKLRFRTEYEQLLWSECSRLIANCIIYYNATILSHLLAHKENTGDKYGAELVKEVSPVAWQHINLYGRYELKATRACDRVGGRPEKLSVRDKQQIRAGSKTPKFASKTWRAASESASAQCVQTRRRTEVAIF